MMIQKIYTTQIYRLAGTKGVLGMLNSAIKQEQRKL